MYNSRTVHISGNIEDEYGNVIGNVYADLIDSYLDLNHEETITETICDCDCIICIEYPDDIARIWDGEQLKQYEFRSDVIYVLLVFPDKAGNVKTLEFIIMQFFLWLFYLLIIFMLLAFTISLIKELAEE